MVRTILAEIQVSSMKVVHMRVTIDREIYDVHLGDVGEYRYFLALYGDMYGRFVWYTAQERFEDCVQIIGTCCGWRHSRVDRMYINGNSISLGGDITRATNAFYPSPSVHTFTFFPLTFFQNSLPRRSLPLPGIETYITVKKKSWVKFID